MEAREAVALAIVSRAGRGAGALALCFVSTAWAASDTLRVTLLGTGNPRPSLERFGPSILVEAGDQRLLIDAGRGAATRLFQIGQAKLLSGIDEVFLTHLHSDHIVGLPDVWLTGWIFGRTRPLPILGPPGTERMLSGLKQAFEFDSAMRRSDERLPEEGIGVDAHDIEPGVVYQHGKLKVTAFAVDHGSVKPAYGYRVDYGARSVAFSGDTRFSEELIERTRGVDVLVHEVVSPEVERQRAQVQDSARVERIIAHHTTPEDAGRVFARVAPRLAVYSHIVPTPTRPRDLIPPTRTTYTGPLEVGYDLMLIVIGERIEVSKRHVIKD